MIENSISSTRIVRLEGSAKSADVGWNASKVTIYLWWVVQLLLVENPLQPSSFVRVMALRLFGAQVGEGVVIRSRVRVRFPWNLRIGDRSWIGEGVQISNRRLVEIGQDCVVSQDSFLTTGSHAFRTDMSVVSDPIFLRDGCWVTSRCVILAGSIVGESAVVLPNTVVDGEVPSGKLYSAPRAEVIGSRFSSDSEGKP